MSKRLVHVRGQLPFQLGPTMAKLPGLRPRGSLPHVVEVVGVDPDQFESEVTLAHVRVAQDHGLLAQIQPRDRVERVVVRAAPVAVCGVGEPGGMPELVHGRVRGEGRVALPRSPTCGGVGRCRYRGTVDERLQSGGVGVLRMPVVDLAGQEGWIADTNMGAP